MLRCRFACWGLMKSIDAVSIASNYIILWKESSLATWHFCNSCKVYLIDGTRCVSYLSFLVTIRTDSRYCMAYERRINNTKCFVCEQASFMSITESNSLVFGRASFMIKWCCGRWFHERQRIGTKRSQLTYSILLQTMRLPHHLELSKHTTVVQGTKRISFAWLLAPLLPHKGNGPRNKPLHKYYSPICVHTVDSDVHRMQCNQQNDCGLCRNCSRVLNNTPSASLHSWQNVPWQAMHCTVCYRQLGPLQILL